MALKEFMPDDGIACGAKAGVLCVAGNADENKYEEENFSHV
jgi:hypothetical protein